MRIGVCLLVAACASASILQFTIVNDPVSKVRSQGWRPYVDEAAFDLIPYVDYMSNDEQLVDEFVCAGACV